MPRSALVNDFDEYTHLLSTNIVVKVVAENRELVFLVFNASSLVAAIRFVRQPFYSWLGVSVNFSTAQVSYSKIPANEVSQ